MSQPANDEFSQHLSDEESIHEDASDTGAAPKQQQQVIPQTTAISNIKLPILKKEEYDIWAMEMEHYLEYIDNEVWKVIQNGNSKKRISTGKDGIVRVLSPITAAEIQARSGKPSELGLVVMQIQRKCRRLFSNNSLKHLKYPIQKGLEKGYDRFQQQLLSQLESHGAEKIDNLSIDDLYNNLRVFEQEIQGASKTSSSAQNVAFVSQSKSSTNKVKSGFTDAYSTCTPSTSSTNVPKKEVLASFANEVIYSLFAKQTEDWDLLHEDLEQIDDVDIKEMDINWQIAMIAIRMKKFYKKTGRRVCVDGKTPKKRYSLYHIKKAGKQEKNQWVWPFTMDDGIVNWGEHTEVDTFKCRDINWQIAMIAIRMKKFYKKTRRGVRVDGKAPVGFDKKKLECFNCYNTGHFARDYPAKGTHDGKKKRDSFYQHQEAGKQEKNQMRLLTMDDGIVNWGEHTENEETNDSAGSIV
ncbi:ribonuclease H-like domain-containing protein [Tanacetum coccineum]